MCLYWQYSNSILLFLSCCGFGWQLINILHDLTLDHALTTIYCMAQCEMLASLFVALTAATYPASHLALSCFIISASACSFSQRAGPCLE